MKTSTKTKLIVFGTLMGTLGLAGVSRFASAGPAQPPYATISPYHSLQNTGVSDRDRETNDGAREQAEDPQESAKLQALAKVTPQQAQQAAKASQGGQASGVKLENENGSLVYTVEIGNREVTVDAGNGKVLYTETANQENRANEANHPRGSIQVSEASGGDGDGETNDDG